jgi:hypothetical protein
MSSPDRDFPARLAKARENVSAIKSELAAIETAATPLAEATRNLDAWLQSQLADERCADIGIEELTYPAHLRYEMPTLTGHKLEGLLLRVMLPQVREHFAKKLAAHYADTQPGLDENKRAAKLQALRAKLFDAEIAEERIIVEADQAGVFLMRRSDIDPRVLVEVLA